MGHRPFFFCAQIFSKHSCRFRTHRNSFMGLHRLNVKPLDFSEQEFPQAASSAVRVTLFGAAEEVTGSCYLVETERARILIDCGMFQGSERLERQNKIPADILLKPLNAVLLTHAHLDHCGRLPLLVKAGYNGPIYATEGTIDIANLILNDAAHIEEDDTERENQRRKTARQTLVKSLFQSKDVAKVNALFESVIYNQSLPVADGMMARFVEAGHIIGSACIELSITDSENNEKILVFSGDVGHWNAPIVRDPARIQKADLVFMESTYGDRQHPSLAQTLQEFETLLKRTIQNKGKVLIPTFAVGRAQEILYFVAAMIRDGKIPAIPIFLDSPMAILATKLYTKHWKLMDENSQRLENSGQLKKDLSSLKTCQTALESRALNNFEGPCLILAGAGMCNAGRILHHMRHCLNDPKTTMIIVGYQAKGSIGRELIEGAKEVKVLGQTVHVKATVKGLSGFSAHADQLDLLKWLEPMVSGKPKVVLTHGENHSIDQLAYEIEQKFHIICSKPKLGEFVELK
ncbi:MBL fold metallo-hydrolase [soil metagenome]